MFHKRMRLAISVLSLASLVLWGAPSSASADPIGLCGTVVSMASDLPVAGARVSAGGLSALTDSQGRYALSLPPGIHDVRAQAPGFIGMTYCDLQIREGEQTILDLAMVPSDPTQEEASAIDARLLQASQEAASPVSAPSLAQGFAPSEASDPPSTIRVLMEDQTVVIMDMDEYLKGVVPQEMSPYWPIEALRAQAVAARSYASTRSGHLDMGADVCTTTHCQVWRPIHYDTTDRAVDDTTGVTAKHEGSIIHAYFFGHCDGHTRSSEEVWGGRLPYCQSVVCSCTDATMWGHGVGMCQAGAKAMAQQGASYVEILKHYYTGIEVVGGDLPSIGEAGVSPSLGDEGTLFTFQATYRGEEGSLPAVANVIIDGRAHSLTFVPDVSDDGRTYRYQTYLPAGPHAYEFYFCHDSGVVSRWPASGSMAGPSVSSGGSPGSLPPGSSTVAGSITYSTQSDWALGTPDGVEITGQGDGALALSAGYSTGTYTSDALEAPLSFVALGIDWYGTAFEESSVALDMRISEDGVAWSVWQRVLPGEDEGQESAATPASLLFGSGNWLQYRLTMSRDAQGRSPVLENLRIICIDSTKGATSGELATVAESSADGAPPVISRQQWGADESLMSCPPEYATVQAVIIHHTATNDGAVDPAAMVRAIYYYHAVALQWGDIGYHYLIDKYGNIYEGRYGGAGVIGHHAGAYNTGSLGVSLIGNYQDADPPASMLSSLTSLLAWQCAEHWIPPDGEHLFIDRVLPTLLGHRDVGATQCPGDKAYALLPSIRSQTLSKTTAMVPELRVDSPVDGEAVHGVASVSFGTNVAVTAASVYVDGVLRGNPAPDALIYRWNTTLETEGDHVLRIVVENKGGQSECSLTVRVDNTPPSGIATAPEWSTSLLIPVEVETQDASHVQFSNGWVWEGESLKHQAGTGVQVSDPDAANGLAWLGRAGTDVRGWWYGPYTLGLFPWREYQAYFRIKTSDTSVPTDIARLDVSDNRGLRIYAEQAISASDLAVNDAYAEVPITFSYQSTSATWEGMVNGVEFRTWFCSSSDLYLDRVTVFDAPQALTDQVSVRVAAKEGAQEVRVRFLDEAGNVSDSTITVHLDMTPPEWLEVTPYSALVQDTVSGLDTTTAAWSASFDGGSTWGAWQPLTVEAPRGTCEPILLQVDEGAAECVRFRVQDVAGNAREVGYSTLVPEPTSTSPSPQPAFQIPLLYKGFQR